MVKAELIKRSPLRILDKSTHGGLKVGELGIIASARGAGKTACLVHIATDQLFQGRRVIHLSFSQKTDHIIRWYDAIFSEIATVRDLSSAVEIHDDLVKHRVIMRFNQATTNAGTICRSIGSLVADANFSAEVIVIDGYVFNSGTPAFVAELKQYAKEHKLTLWFTADIDETVPGNPRVPPQLSAYLELVDILITLTNQKDYLCLTLIKDQQRFLEADLNLRLDPKTMLINDER